MDDFFTQGGKKRGAKGAVAPLFSAGNYYGTAFHFKSLIHCQLNTA